MATTKTKTKKTAKTKPTTLQAEPPERAVLVTTAHRGVFFGYARDTSGPTIALRSARCALYWTRELRGFLGLAATGPTTGCRIGPPADLELRDVTSVAAVAPAAVAAWERAPWSA